MPNSCLGGQHVHRGCFLIAVVGILASVFTACFYLYTTARPLAYIILSLIAFLCYLSLAFGNYVESATCYFPFLIIIPFCILAQLINAFLIFFVVGIGLTTGRRQIIEDPDLSRVLDYVRGHPDYAYDSLRTPHVWVIVLGVIYLISACLQTYFYSVVVRALSYLRKIENGRYLEEITWSRRVH
ncbi:hypothetical protein M3Y95_00642400 [Aphelenchoides besseyi]|nr:hypothetical protein M3Y95_00642400 [Aphelenchoides besseyi]